MARLLKLTAVLLVLAAALSAGAALAQGPPPPLPPGVAPQWVPAPGSPRVAYAPNISGDLFLHGRRYYYFSGGHWYRSKSMSGPWHPVRRLPRAILRLHRPAFNTPPPWRSKGGK